MKGATLYQVQSVGLEEYFNPRSREGSDLGRNVDGYAVALISIHAPVKGATCTVSRDIPSQNFNPRSREGSDVLTFTLALPYIISIHAPVKGATVWFSCQADTIRISIHAPVKGATYQRLQRNSPAPHFNPRSREGSDLK